MGKATDSLMTALSLKPKEHLALVGGGGKTSLMFALADEFSKKNKQVVTSTTTKIWSHEARRSSCIAFIQSNSSWKDGLKEELQTHRHVFLAHSLLNSGKVKGISPSLADELYREPGIDYLIVEADGAAGHPVKAHANHEPVIPASATKVVAMLGIEAMGQKLEPDVVFRMDLFEKLTGLDPGQRLTPSVLAKLFLETEGLFKGSPVSSKRLVFLNKFDLLTEMQEAKELASLILGSSFKNIDRVIIGSILKMRYYPVD
ncbi:MAG: selenium cofactor biosynthesis protein YqeC [Thermodesulfobacteriota bacterium]|nr:selenium cofactor biosynthesis protein YqeC [Thermodesulfobacteriota bacterium]